MGYFRLFLAYLVLFSHTGVRVFGLNEGVFAVVVFYILAGHVVYKLFDGVFKRDFKRFYTDRFLRIFPLYWFFSAITALFLVFTGFGSPQFNWISLTLNFVLVPLNYYMYIEKLITVLKDCFGSWWLIPPAWSLGAEVQVYFILPFLLLFRWLFWVGFFGSFIVYTLANLNVLHSDYFGYRLVVGVLFIFLIGALIQKIFSRKGSFFEKVVLGVVYIFCLLWFLVVVVYFGKYGAYTKETLLGIIFGVPTVFFLLWLKGKKRIRFEKFVGSLSYAVFLAHFLCIWIAQWIGIKCSDTLALSLFVFLTANLIAVAGVLLIDFPVMKARFNWLKT